MADFADLSANLPERLDVLLAELLPQPAGPAARLAEAMAYAVKGGGKRVRARLVLLSGQVFGVAPGSCLRTGAAIECLHAYSLIHDDLPCMDDALTRRGKPACHRAFDEATAVLAGDALQALAFEILSDPLTHAQGSVRAELTLELARAAGAGGMCAGQMVDLLAQGHVLDLAAIYAMERLKTGALIRFSAQAGGILAQAEPHHRAALGTYGEALGLAFQIRDDLIDIQGDAEAAGKDLGRDQASAKATPVALLGSAGAEAELDRLAQAASTALADLPGDVAGLQSLIGFVVNRDR